MDKKNKEEISQIITEVIKNGENCFNIAARVYRHLKLSDLMSYFADGCKELETEDSLLFFKLIYTLIVNKYNRDELEYALDVIAGFDFIIRPSLYEAIREIKHNGYDFLLRFVIALAINNSEN